MLKIKRKIMLIGGSRAIIIPKEWRSDLTHIILSGDESQLHISDIERSSDLKNKLKRIIEERIQRSRDALDEGDINFVKYLKAKIEGFEIALRMIEEAGI